MTLVRNSDDKSRRESILACLTSLDAQEAITSESALELVKAGLDLFDRITTPNDTDFFQLSKLYVELSQLNCEKHLRAQHVAALENAKAALGRCVASNDNFHRNMLYVKSHEAKQELYFPELQQESLAALEEALKHYHQITQITVDDMYALINLYKRQASLMGDQHEKKIPIWTNILDLLAKIPEKNSARYERAIVHAHLRLAKLYRYPQIENYVLALAHVRAGINVLESNPEKTDWHFSELSVFYHNMALDLSDSKGPEQEIEQAYLTSLDMTDKIREKKNNDYKGAIKTLYYLARFYVDHGKHHLLGNYIVPFFRVLNAIKEIGNATLSRVETIIRLMGDVVYCDRGLLDALYFAGKMVEVSQEPQVNPFIAFLYEYCGSSAHLVTRKTALVLIDLIGFLLNAAQNKTLPSNDFKFRLELETFAGADQPELEEVKQLKTFRVMLQEHPVHKLLSQMEGSMTVMAAMAARIQYLEAETEALKEQLAELRPVAAVERVESGEPPNKRHAGLFDGRSSLSVMKDSMHAYKP